MTSPVEALRNALYKFKTYLLTYTILLWSRGRSLAWDVTVPDYADAHVVNTAREAGTAANQQEHQVRPANTHVFVAVAIETGVLGTIRRWNWYWRLEDGRPTLQAMRRSPPSCSSSCPWHYRGVMRSHFKTRSPPASSLQSVVSLPARRTAQRGLCYGNVSVCLSVTPGIVSKRLNLS